jgi:hypothetical protein
MSETKTSEFLAPPSDWLGWTTCPACAHQFLAMRGVDMRCPTCAHEFEVREVADVRDFSWTEGEPPVPACGPDMIARAEMWAARLWAEASADGTDEDAEDWKFAWRFFKLAKEFGGAVVPLVRQRRSGAAQVPGPKGSLGQDNAT